MTEIRPISLTDVPQFHAALDSVARERRYLHMLVAPSLEKTREFISNTIAKDYAQFVAVEAGRIIGWCDITPGMHGEAHVGHVGMGIIKEHRGLGLGRRLLAATLAKARTQAYEKIELTVYASNRSALALYRKFGFVEEGMRKRGRLVDGIYDDIILMALFLK